MEPNEIESYGKWVVRKLEGEGKARANRLPDELLSAALAVWPRVATLVANALKREGSSEGSEALALDIWEEVLRSVIKAVNRNGDYSASIRDPESYLLVAFQHRFRRFQKAERVRRERFPSASASLDLGLVEGAQDTTWILELERAITVRQITDRMDPWTKRAWQARQFGYSWKEIAARSGLTEQAAKKKFEYGLEKTRRKIIRLLKTEKVKGLS